ncbi:hypothetical protein R5R35_002494 [Gryllus longicercus]|uniref:Uncharacterized protein n=1 Tax=Gryllus longicercus TaxID=2509291 RepID=A0AAN9Z3Q2_9ORTH|nr:Pyrimidodiazepine synthase [Gryllus bimaculatus]
MSVKHLSIGSTNPPLQRGKWRLYSMRFCPYAQRVHLVLDAKKIPYDVVYINLTEKPEWIYDKSPQGKVPVIECDGETLYESLVIADFLDEKYQGRPLYPKDLVKKAKDKILIEHFHSVIGSLYKISKFNASSEEYLDDFLAGLDVYEAELVKRGKPFFGGDKPGMVDYMIWPWCERADMLKIVGGDKFVLPKERFRRLMEWRQAMKDDDAVKASYLEPTIHAQYLKSFRAGYPDYDSILNK